MLDIEDNSIKYSYISYYKNNENVYNNVTQLTINLKYIQNILKNILSLSNIDSEDLEDIRESVKENNNDINNSYCDI